MTENELAIVEMLRNANNPERAILIALDILTRLLEQHEASE